jgi:hypothetical protein
MTMQRAAVHREQRRDAVGAGVTGDQRRLQHAAHLCREVVAVPGLERVDLLLQQAAQLGVDVGQRPVQPVRGEHQPVVAGVETQRGIEEAAIRLDVVGPAVREKGLGRCPAATAQAAHDVQQQSHAAVAELVGGREVRQAQSKHRLLTIDCQLQSRAAAVQMDESRDAAQRRGHVRRVLRQQPDEPERVQPGLLAHQQAEVRTAGPGRAMREQAAAHRLRDAVVRAVEQRRFKPLFREHLGRIGAEAAQDVGNRENGADAHGCLLRGDTRSRPWPVDQ